MIIARIREAAFGLNPADLETPTVTPGTANGLDYVDIRVVYNARLNAFPFSALPVMIQKTRRVYLP